MKKGLLVVVALLVIAGVYVGFIRDAQLVLETPNRAYRLQTPKMYLRVDTQTQTHPSPWGDIKATIKTAQAAFGLDGIMISYFEMPEESDQGRSETEMLTDSLDGMMTSISGKRSAATEIEFRGNTGLECTYHGRHQSTVVFGIIRAFVIDQDMIYLMTVGTSEAAKTDPDMLAYLDTFTY